VSLAPLTRGALAWPIFGVHTIPPFQVPLLNTVILLMSGVTATLAHYETLGRATSTWLPISVLLGLYFVCLQGIEYSEASYSIHSRVYGSLFFFGTGFHGLHVCLGAAILIVSSLRVFSLLVRKHHHFGLEFRL